jgi:hypothetical protein
VGPIESAGHDIDVAPIALDAPGFQIYFGGVGVEKGWPNPKPEMAFADGERGDGGGLDP